MAIRSKPPSKEYKEGFDRIYRTKCLKCDDTGLVPTGKQGEVSACLCDKGAIYRTIQG